MKNRLNQNPKHVSRGAFTFVLLFLGSVATLATNAREESLLFVANQSAEAVSNETQPASNRDLPSTDGESSSAVGNDEGAEDVAAEQMLESISFENRVYFKEQTIRGFVGHPVPGYLDQKQLEQDVLTIQERYKARGFFYATVKLRFEPGTEMFSQKVTFVIAPGERAPLTKVEIIGNRSVTDKQLREGFFSREYSLTGVLSQAGLYHKPFMDQDGQRLVANYYQYGFLEARVLRTRIEAQVDMKGIHAIMDVVEGPKYELINITIGGEAPDNVSYDSWRERITVKDGDTANLIKIQQEAEVLLNDLRELGYAFARIEQSVQIGSPPSGRSENRGVSLALNVIPGPPAIVGEVRIVGNTGLLYGTMNHVIRRDIEFESGDPYRFSNLEQSRRQLMRLGYFSQVELRALPSSKPGVVDIEVTVQEQPTWLFNITPFYLSTEGFVLIGILADRNLVGSGLSVSATGQLSFQRQVFDVSLSEPRLFNTRVGVSVEGHRREYNYPDFKIRSDGGGSLRFHVPFLWDIFAGAGMGVEYGGVVNYEPEFRKGAPLPPSALFPQKVFRNVVDGSVLIDKRDSIMSPRNGMYGLTRLSYAGMLTLSGTSFLKWEGDFRFYWTPFWNLTLKSSTRLGYTVNLEGEAVPVTDRYFLGGYRSVRGYRYRSIGPNENIELLPGVNEKIQIGGVRQLLQSAEIEFPLWSNTPFRGFFFVDAGNAFSEVEPWFTLWGQDLDRETDILPLGLFWSGGFGFLIETPIFPLRFEWSVPLTRRETDQPFDFFFGFGSAF